MATLALAVAGAAVGSALFPAGLTILGATLTGATLGSQVGALAGSFIDQSLLGASGHPTLPHGPRLSDLRVTASSEGAPIPRLYGRARLGGQVVWATNLEEEVVQQGSQSGGGKGGSSQSQASAGIEYRYFANFAVALAEGQISGLGRVWADGQELDLSTVTYRLYTGSEDQLPDSLIEAKEGAGNAPAYRGLAYIVFERMALAPFGNRIPQLSFEVHRAVDAFDGLVRAVCLIPGAGEFVYGPQSITRKVGRAINVSENVHTLQGGANWDVAIDQLQAALPNADSVSLVVGWFGNDLRAGTCQVRPGVDSADKVTAPLIWGVAGVFRARGPPRQPGRGPRGLWRHAVGPDGGRRHPGPAGPRHRRHAGALHLHGRARRQRAARPLHRRVLAAGLPLARPHHRLPRRRPARHPRQDLRGGHAGRGLPRHRAGLRLRHRRRQRLLLRARPSGPTAASSCTTRISPPRPAASRPSSSARSCAGSAKCATAPAPIRSWPGSSSSPPTSRPCSATGTKVTYAADWSEYFGHQPADGSGDVYFHLDPLWSSSHIDAVGIDLYWPLADWRDGADHVDRQAGVPSTYDLNYLRGNIFAGEGYDWYYASPADRDAQTRTPITDGAGKPWVFRFKDIRNWWLSQHFNRPAGAESATPTAWVPQGKPFWLTELGCPAVDKGANQPNVFVDPEELRVAAALLFARHPRRRHAAPLPAGIPRGLRSRAPRLRRRRQPDVGRLLRAHARSRPHPRLLLGRAPLPGLPRQHRRVGRRRQLAARPLGHRPPRQCAARCHGLRHPRRLRLSRPRRRRAHRLACRLPHRSRALRARGPAAAGACLLHRRARERGAHRLRPPRLASPPSPS